MASSDPRDQGLASERPTVAPQPATDEFGANQVNTLPSSPNPGLAQSLAVLEQLRAGQMLGQYRILERLGAGGMGLVYKAIHPTMERVVALKVITPQLTQDASVRARFQREVRNAARLLHPNVVVAYDAAEVSGLSFLVMEYVEGQDVASLLYRHGRPPIGLACEIIRQAAVGLQYAHELGMVHRDIKPANLMVTTAGAGASQGQTRLDGWPPVPLVKVLDFGLARLAAADGSGGLAASDNVTREGCVVGTPEFMAPEQAQDSRLVDIRSDIYSLGCTLYNLLAGRPPFRAPTTYEVLVMHLRQPPDPLAHFCPGIPPELAAVIHRTLAKQPHERYQTPGELAGALLPWAQKGAIFSPAPAPGAAPPAPSPAPPAPGTLGQAAAPPAAPARAPQPVRPAERVIPFSVMWMHFQALARTILLIVLVAALVVGCVWYLPDIGQRVMNAVNKIKTPHSARTPSTRK